MAPLRRRRPDRALALALFAVSAATSVLLDAGLVCSNDGAHYALVRALAEDHSARIDGQLGYAQGIDYSEHDGHAYSDRPPGTALAAPPFDLVARALGASDAGRQFACALLAALAGALATVLTYLIARRLGLSLAGATAAALALALCTPVRTYPSALWNPAPAAALTPPTVWLALGLEKKRAGAGLLALGGGGGCVGGAAGYVVGVDYSTALSSVLLVALVGWRWRRDLGALAPLVLGCALGLAPALAYHTIAFGGPFATPYQFHNLRYHGGVFANTR